MAIQNLEEIGLEYALEESEKELENRYKIIYEELTKEFRRLNAEEEPLMETLKQLGGEEEIRQLISLSKKWEDKKGREYQDSRDRQFLFGLESREEMLRGEERFVKDLKRRARR